MAKALLRVGSALKSVGKYQVFGLAMFTIGGIYVAVLITIPRLAYLAFRLM